MASVKPRGSRPTCHPSIQADMVVEHTPISLLNLPLTIMPTYSALPPAISNLTFRGTSVMGAGIFPTHSKVQISGSLRGWMGLSQTQPTARSPPKSFRISTLPIQTLSSSGTSGRLMRAWLAASHTSPPHARSLKQSAPSQATPSGSVSLLVVEMELPLPVVAVGRDAIVLSDFNASAKNIPGRGSRIHREAPRMDN